MSTLDLTSDGPLATKPAPEAAYFPVAQQHVRDILALAIEHSSENSALVVSDTQSGLARILTHAYRTCLPNATLVNFDAVSPEAIMRAFASLKAGDLVVLIQSTSFRLEAFRIRVELFKRGLKVIEHPHLARMKEHEYGHYVESLAYDPAYYRVVGPALKERIDRATTASVDSGGEQLIYESGFEPAKLNIGDYSQLKNVGGQFPIGEVFTEPKELERVNGRVRIFVFGDTTFHVNVPDKPITLVVQRGKVVEVVDSSPEFDRVIAQIRSDEEVWIREFGFGMNRALTRDRTGQRHRHLRAHVRRPSVPGRQARGLQQATIEAQRKQVPRGRIRVDRKGPP